MEETESTNQRKQRKEEARMQKKQRIVASGGTRPRSASSNERPDKMRRTTAAPTTHRFGRVMEQAPCRNIPRFSTLSIAIPGSIMTNCQTKELQTILCGQIARMATIYHVDEIVVYDDQLSHTRPQSPDRSRSRPPRDSGNSNQTNQDDPHHSTTADPQVFMGRILQYCECPQYLRRHFFPLHADLQYTGLLPPMDAPHHVRAQDRSPYREGVVLAQVSLTSGSLVNCGIRNRPVHIDQRLQAGIRCTIQIDPSAYGRPGTIHGKVVSPSSITQMDGTYWGYTVRIAASLKSALEDSPYSDAYDLTIGTSERGNESIDDPNFSLQQRTIHKSSGSYRHALIVFGGVAGIEECIDADESIHLSGAKSSTLFDKWINICPYQGSRTIRTEEAISIALAKLSPFLQKAAQTKQSKKGPSNSSTIESAALTLPDEEALSEESSDEDDP